MRLRRRNFEHRVQRMRLRASSQLPPVRLETLAQPASMLAERSPAAQTRAEADPRRRSSRLPLGSEISVRKAGSFSFQLPALNISPDGCRVELVEMVDVNERVIVRLPALEPLGAEVAWVGGNHAGLRFQRPLHPAVFDQLVDRFSACAA
jgi:hypothetical protein